MASLLNTTWIIKADNYDFVGFTVQFSENGRAKITFSIGAVTLGNWDQGEQCFSFLLKFTFNGSPKEIYNCIGSHQDGKGSGIAFIEWGKGVQRSPFSMSKQK